MKGELVSIIGDRAVSLFSNAIYSENGCLICSAFSRKILIVSDENPDDAKRNVSERLLKGLG